jgi:hypothetical protein
MTWIKCAERMPDKGRPVLVFGKERENEKALVWLMQWTRDNVWLSPGNYWDEIQPSLITHWQPLPEPPNAD